MSLLRSSVCLCALIQMTLSLSILASDRDNNGDDGPGTEIDNDSGLDALLLSRIERLGQLMTSDETYGQGHAAVGPMTSRRLAKRDDVDGSADGEYVMGFWMPKKRAELPPLAPSEPTNRLREWLAGIRSGYGAATKRANPYWYVRRRTCDLTRLTPEHIVEYLRSGKICGRRVSHVRFGLTGRR